MISVNFINVSKTLSQGKNNQGEKEPSHRLPPLLHSTCTQTPQERRNMYKDRNCVFH